MIVNASYTGFMGFSSLLISFHVEIGVWGEAPFNRPWRMRGSKKKKAYTFFYASMSLS